ncbi:MAG: glycosyltransferase family 2 protein [Pseudomonadota bacterium]
MTQPAAQVQHVTRASQVRSVLFCAVKDEGPFLLEWIAYHKVIGFHRIILFANPSQDGTNEILSALAAQGEIEYYENHNIDGLSAQGSAAQRANAMGLIADGEWVIWLDADEFLVVHTGEGQVSDLIAVVGDRLGILVPWRIMGDSHNASFPGRFISKDFTGASKRWAHINMQVKTLYRHGDHIAGFGIENIHRPHLKADAGLTCDDFMLANGKTLSEASPRNARWLAGSDHKTNGSILGEEHGYALAQINHYCVRTPEHFALKRSRGRGWKANQIGEANDRHTPEFYAQMNRNDTQSNAILKHEGQVDREIARLQEDFETRHAVARSNALVAERIAKLQATSEPLRPASAFEVTLPDDARAAVTEHYRDADVVLEYGSGGSSVLAMELGVKRLVSVESDAAWAERLTQELRRRAEPERFVIRHVDIGPTKSWGRTADASGYARYHRYSMSVWDELGDTQPDIVLIDGRFRVACFLATLLHAKKQMRVLFDDYYDRPAYAVCEAFAKPAARWGRMAAFDIVPTAPTIELVQSLVAYSVDQT